MSPRRRPRPPSTGSGREAGAAQTERATGEEPPRRRHLRPSAGSRRRGGNHVARPRLPWPPPPIWEGRREPLHKTGEAAEGSRPRRAPPSGLLRWIWRGPGTTSPPAHPPGPPPDLEGGGAAAIGLGEAPEGPPTPRAAPRPPREGRPGAAATGHPAHAAPPPPPWREEEGGSEKPVEEGRERELRR